MILTRTLSTLTLFMLGARCNPDPMDGRHPLEMAAPPVVNPLPPGHFISECTPDGIMEYLRDLPEEAYICAACREPFSEEELTATNRRGALSELAECRGDISAHLVHVRCLRDYPGMVFSANGHHGGRIVGCDYNTFVRDWEHFKLTNILDGNFEMDLEHLPVYKQLDPQGVRYLQYLEGSTQELHGGLAQFLVSGTGRNALVEDVIAYRRAGMPADSRFIRALMRGIEGSVTNLESPLLVIDYFTNRHQAVSGEYFSTMYRLVGTAFLDTIKNSEECNAFGGALLGMLVWNHCDAKTFQDFEVRFLNHTHRLLRGTGYGALLRHALEIGAPYRVIHTMALRHRLYGLPISVDNLFVIAEMIVRFRIMNEPELWVIVLEYLGYYEVLTQDHRDRLAGLWSGSNDGSEAFRAVHSALRGARPRFQDFASPERDLESHIGRELHQVCAKRRSPRDKTLCALQIMQLLRNNPISPTDADYIHNFWKQAFGRDYMLCYLLWHVPVTKQICEDELLSMSSAISESTIYDRPALLIRRYTDWSAENNVGYNAEVELVADKLLAPMFLRRCSVHRAGTRYLLFGFNRLRTRAGSRAKVLPVCYFYPTLCAMQHVWSGRLNTRDGRNVLFRVLQNKNLPIPIMHLFGKFLVGVDEGWNECTRYLEEVLRMAVRDDQNWVYGRESCDALCRLLETGNDALERIVYFNFKALSVRVGSLANFEAVSALEINREELDSDEEPFDEGPNDVVGPLRDENGDAVLAQGYSDSEGEGESEEYSVADWAVRLER